jgi:hypothetical protein
MGGHVFEESNGFGSFAGVQEELGQLLDGGLVVGVFLEHAAQDVFGLFVIVAQAVEASQPESGFRVARVEAVNFGVLLDGASDDFGLTVADAEVAEAAEINPAEKATGLEIVGVALEERLSFGDGFVSTLGFPVHFGEAFADNRGLGIEGVGLFVGLDGLRSEFGFAGGFVLLLVDVAHGEVVVGVGAGGLLGNVGGRDRGGVLRARRGVGIFWCGFGWRWRRSGALGERRGGGDGRDQGGDGYALRVHEGPKKLVSHVGETRSKVKRLAFPVTAPDPVRCHVR